MEDAPAWNPNLRSQTAIRTTDTRYFVEPSIAVAAMGIGPNGLITDLKTIGFLFEIKLGGDKLIEEGVATLKKLAKILIYN